MASFNYNSVIDDMTSGNIDFGSDTFKVLLVTDSYIPDKRNHTKRSDITNEVSGSGYLIGGADVTVTKTVDSAHNIVNVSLGSASWANSTITARGAVYFKSLGGASSNDPLISFIEFVVAGVPADVRSINGLFSLSHSTMRIENPD